MTKRRMGLMLLAAFGGCIGGLVVEELFIPKPALAQDSYLDMLKRNSEKLHEKELAGMGALKIQVSPVDPKRCVGFSVVIAPGDREVRVFRAFEDGRVEQFKQPTGIGQSADWAMIGKPN